MSHRYHWHRRVSLTIATGATPKEVARVVGATESEVLDSIEQHKDLTRWYKYTVPTPPEATLGSKTESYWTEEEMLIQGISSPFYSYDSLSEDEQKIYNDEPWKDK